MGSGPTGTAARTTDPNRLRRVRPLLVLHTAVRLAILLLLVGCSAQLGPDRDRVGDDDGKGDNGLAPDAALAPTPDATPTPAAVVDNACGVATDHGDLGTIAGQARSALQEGSTTQRVGTVSTLIPQTDAQAAPDYIVVELWDNYGVFAGGAARTGTFQLTGNEANYNTCGVCLVQLANVTNNTAAKLLLATSGTVTVTSVATATGQTMQVSVSNASFVEIAATDTGYQTVAGSSCPSPISNVGLSGTL